MSLRVKPTNDTNSVDARILSSNHKVIHYLQNSTPCPDDNQSPNPLISLHKTHQFYHEKDPSMNNDRFQPRLRSCSDNGSSSSVIDTLSRSDFSLGSSLSDPDRHFSIVSSNGSSSGIYSTSSDTAHEEGASTSSEDLDFNLGFDQISDSDDNEVANLDEIDEEDEREQNKDENQQTSTKNSAATLIDMTDSNLDERINELEEFLRNSYSSTGMDDDYEFNNYDTITANQTKQQLRASFLHDSTHTLYPHDRFSAFTEDDDHENEQITKATGVRSNSLGIVHLNGKSALLDKAPKKAVHFADMMGQNLESIRYMTPPDQSTNLLIQECIRVKLEELCLAKNQANPSSSPFDLKKVISRSASTFSFFSPKKVFNQYCLISKYFTSPTDIIPLIYEQHIRLECLYTKDAIAYGTVRVHNCAYDKRVFARITENEWETTHDTQAWHSMNYPNDNTDAFTFEIGLEKFKEPTDVPKQIYFAICLQAMSQEFWDNNRGWNYVLDVVERP